MSTLFFAKKFPAELQAGDLIVVFKSPLEELRVDRQITLLYEIVDPNHGIDHSVVTGLQYRVVDARRVFPHERSAVQQLKLSIKGRYYATVPPMFATTEAVDPRG